LFARPREKTAFGYNMCISLFAHSTRIFQALFLLRRRRANAR
jgi:hypothetical protein